MKKLPAKVFLLEVVGYGPFISEKKVDAPTPVAFTVREVV